LKYIDCMNKDKCDIYQDFINICDSDCSEYSKEKESKDDVYKNICVEFCNYIKEEQKKSFLFSDNDGEVIKSKWEEIVKKNMYLELNTEKKDAQD